MRIAVPLLILLAWSVDAGAVTRRLAGDCSFDAAFVPTELQPFDMDWCSIAEGDDITALLVDVAARWGAVYVRAPSRTLTVRSDTIQWATAVSGKPIKDFVFLEDQNAANKLTIQHVPSNPNLQLSLLYDPCNTDPIGGPVSLNGKYILWVFANYRYVKIGGSNLSMTLVGTHPGLGNASERMCGTYPAYVRDINAGLLDFRLKDNSSPQLVDLRVNTRDSEAYSIYFYGSNAIGTAENRAQQVNISGTHWNTSGVFAHAGVRNIWFDPNRTVISDPYVRNMGWDGAVATTFEGRMVGCHDRARASFRQNNGPYFVERLTGGVTFQYGYVGFSPRVVNYVGSGPTDPFVIRLKDWGSSGPGTGYPAGVMVKQIVQPIFFKGDPHYEYGRTQPFRFVRFESLPSDYGSGFFEGTLTGCAAGNGTNNNFPDLKENIIRLESNDNAGPNFGWDVTFAGDWNTKWRRGQLIYLAYEPWSTSDRSYGHVLRAQSGTTLTDTAYLVDTNTVTGLGTFRDIAVQPVKIYQSTSSVQPKNNRIQDTNIAGTVTVSSSAGTTTISNAKFTGGARTVLNVGSGSVVNVSKLCVPAGSQIGGTGTVYYNGQLLTLPHTLAAANDCAIGAQSVPEPPGNLTIE